MLAPATVWCVSDLGARVEIPAGIDEATEVPVRRCGAAARHARARALGEGRQRSARPLRGVHGAHRPHGGRNEAGAEAGAGAGAQDPVVCRSGPARARAALLGRGGSDPLRSGPVAEAEAEARCPVVCRSGPARARAALLGRGGPYPLRSGPAAEAPARLPFNRPTCRPGNTAPAHRPRDGAQVHPPGGRPAPGFGPLVRFGGRRVRRGDDRARPTAVPAAPTTPGMPGMVMAEEVIRRGHPVLTPGTGTGGAAGMAVDPAQGRPASTRGYRRRQQQGKQPHCRRRPPWHLDRRELSRTRTRVIEMGTVRTSKDYRCAFLIFIIII